MGAAVTIRSALAPFACSTRGGVATMNAEPSIVCNHEGAHGRMTIVGGVVLALYGLGVPLAFGAFLITNYDAVVSDQALRQAGSGDTALTNPHFRMRTRYRKIYEDYNPRFVYWKLVLLARKLCFACVVVLLPGNIQAQVRKPSPSAPDIRVS